MPEEPTVNRRLKLSVHPLISEKGRGAGGWINCQWPIISSIVPCNETTIKTPRVGLQRASRLGKQNAPCATVPIPRLHKDRNPSFRTSPYVSPHDCWFRAFNILCSKLEIWWVNKFPEFCEPLYQINPTQGGVPGNLWFIVSWSQVQETTWTCNWHCHWRGSLEPPVCSLGFWLASEEEGRPVGLSPFPVESGAISG